MKFGAPDGRLLQKPFPSVDDARYPSLYLDDAFQDKSLNAFNAVRHICDELDNIPPALVHLSTQNMMKQLWDLDRKEHEDHSAQELALTLLVRLDESDRPALVQNLALQTLLGRREASSWHRQLLKLSNLRRLLNTDAEAYIERFADGILARMPTRGDKQRDASHTDIDMDAEAGAAQQTSAKPFVKFTTLKALAQVLRDAECVDEEYMLDVLSRLLERATQPDVRLQIAKTLLSMYGTCSPEFAEKILKSLDTLVVISGNLNESKPVSVLDRGWEAAEDTLELPRVSWD